VFIYRLDFLLGKACEFQRFYCKKCLALFRARDIPHHEKKKDVSLASTDEKMSETKPEDQHWTTDFHHLQTLRSKQRIKKDHCAPFHS
jgi:hypothetical protein